MGAETINSIFSIGDDGCDELTGDRLADVADRFAQAVLVIVDDVSMVGKSQFAQMHRRFSQEFARRSTGAGRLRSAFLG